MTAARERWVACISVADDVNSARHTQSNATGSHIASGNFFFFLFFFISISIHSLVLRNNFVRVNALLDSIRFFFFFFFSLVHMSHVLSCAVWWHRRNTFSSGAYCRLRMQCISLQPAMVRRASAAAAAAHPRVEVRHCIVCVYLCCIAAGAQSACSVCFSSHFEHIYIFCLSLFLCA